LWGYLWNRAARRIMFLDIYIFHDWLVIAFGLKEPLWSLYNLQWAQVPTRCECRVLSYREEWVTLRNEWLWGWSEWEDWVNVATRSCIWFIIVAHRFLIAWFWKLLKDIFIRFYLNLAFIYWFDLIYQIWKACQFSLLSLLKMNYNCVTCHYLFIIVTYWVGCTHATPCTSCADPGVFEHSGRWSRARLIIGDLRGSCVCSQSLFLLPCLLFFFLFVFDTDSYRHYFLDWLFRCSWHSDSPMLGLFSVLYFWVYLLFTKTLLLKTLDLSFLWNIGSILKMSACLVPSPIVKLMWY